MDNIRNICNNNNHYIYYIGKSKHLIVGKNGMPDFKHIIPVNREKEKRLYQVFHELQKKGECNIDNANTPEWHGTLIKFGRHADDLIKNGFLDPIWHTDKKGFKDSRLIRKKPDIEIIEKKSNNLSFIHFKRRKII